jgi:hypothetical protein
MVACQGVLELFRADRERIKRLKSRVSAVSSATTAAWLHGGAARVSM